MRPAAFAQRAASAWGKPEGRLLNLQTWPAADAGTLRIGGTSSGHRCGCGARRFTGLQPWDAPAAHAARVAPLARWPVILATRGTTSRADVEENIAAAATRA